MKVIDFYHAKTVEEARELSEKFGDRSFYVAGGTSLQYISDSKEKVAIDISALPLKGIVRNSDSFEIGALTTLYDLRTYKADGWVLDDVIKTITRQQIRNVATIGGSIGCKLTWADIPVTLLALNAKICIQEEESYIFEADRYYDKSVFVKPHTGEVIKSVTIPALTTAESFSFFKENRVKGGSSTLSIAAYVKTAGKSIKEIRIVLGNCTSFPVRLKGIEDQLRGNFIREDILENLDYESINYIKVYPREGMSEDYCRHLIKVRALDVVKSVLHKAVGEN